MRVLAPARARRRHYILHVLLVCLAVLFLMDAVSRKPPPPGSRVSSLSVPRNESTPQFRLASDEVDCEHVFGRLRQLYRESKQRRIVWYSAGYPLTALAAPGLDVSEIHLLAIGDSWSRRSSWATLRHLDMCRMGQATPLIPRHECSLHFVNREGGNAVYQMATSALGWDAKDAEINSREFVRIHVHYQVSHHLVVGAATLNALLRSPYPTPGLNTTTFPSAAQCRQSLEQVIEGVDKQTPVCLCEDTLALSGDSPHLVPLDSIQASHGMWDVQRPSSESDLFAFNQTPVDWFTQQARFSPDLSVYPYITWETNVATFRRHLMERYAGVIRQAVQSITVRGGVLMPRVMLSIPPKEDCNAPKFTHYPTLNTSQRCEELAWPLHKVVNDVVEAAYGEARMDLPHVAAPEWLRVVDYRPLSVTESPFYGTYAGETVAPDAYLCTMNDGTHFDTRLFEPSALPHERWCARHAHRLYWDNLR